MADHLLALERDGATIAAIVPPPDIPVAVISSGNQSAVHVAAQRKLAEWSRHGTHRVASRSAHWIQFDEPEVIVSSVRELVSNQPSQPA